MFKWFLKNEKLNSEIKLSNNSSFVILIFAILKFRNIGRSKFRRSNFRLPPIIFVCFNLNKCWKKKTKIRRLQVAKKNFISFKAFFFQCTIDNHEFLYVFRDFISHSPYWVFYKIIIFIKMPDKNPNCFSILGILNSSTLEIPNENRSSTRVQPRVVTIIM